MDEGLSNVPRQRKNSCSGEEGLLSSMAGGKSLSKTFGPELLIVGSMKFKAIWRFGDGG